MQGGLSIGIGLEQFTHDCGGSFIENAYLRTKDQGAEYLLAIALPDTTPVFGPITEAILRAFQAGRLTATRLAP